jgi:hypothetical protein
LAKVQLSCHFKKPTRNNGMNVVEIGSGECPKWRTYWKASISDKNIQAAKLLDSEVYQAPANSGIGKITKGYCSLCTCCRDLVRYGAAARFIAMRVDHEGYPGSRHRTHCCGANPACRTGD